MDRGQTGTVDGLAAQKQEDEAYCCVRTGPSGVSLLVTLDNTYEELQTEQSRLKMLCDGAVLTLVTSWGYNQDF